MIPASYGSDRFTPPKFSTIVGPRFRVRITREDFGMRRMAWVPAVWLLLVVPLSAPAQGGKETLSVDLPGEPATLDPHVQWDSDSYHVYRNIFDNLVTRAPDGKIV